MNQPCLSPANMRTCIGKGKPKEPCFLFVELFPFALCERRRATIKFRNAKHRSLHGCVSPFFVSSFFFPGFQGTRDPLHKSAMVTPLLHFFIGVLVSVRSPRPWFAGLACVAHGICQVHHRLLPTLLHPRLMKKDEGTMGRVSFLGFSCCPDGSRVPWLNVTTLFGQFEVSFLESLR